MSSQKKKEIYAPWRMVVLHFFRFNILLINTSFSKYLVFYSFIYTIIFWFFENALHYLFLVYHGSHSYKVYQVHWRYMLNRSLPPWTLNLKIFKISSTRYKLFLNISWFSNNKLFCMYRSGCHFLMLHFPFLFLKSVSLSYSYSLPQESFSCPLAGAISLCNPFNLVIADEDFRKGFNIIYDKALANSLCKIFKRYHCNIHFL